MRTAVTDPRQRPIQQPVTPGQNQAQYQPHQRKPSGRTPQATLNKRNGRSRNCRQKTQRQEKISHQPLTVRNSRFSKRRHFVQNAGGSFDEVERERGSGSFSQA